MRFALEGRELLNSYGHKHEGGKSGEKVLSFRFTWAVLGGVSRKFHWRLSGSRFCPPPSPFRPLSTTFDHILRLNSLLSIGNLRVHIRRVGRSGEPPEIVANRYGDHERWCLGMWFEKSFQLSVVSSQLAALIPEVKFCGKDMPATQVQEVSAQGMAGKPSRLMSLDVFRGATIAAMILVNNPGDGRTSYWPLEHAKWNGWTPTDLIFPFFLFIVGVAMAYSFASRLRRGESRDTLLSHVLWRGLILFAIGLFLNGFPNHYQLSSWRVY